MTKKIAILNVLCVLIGCAGGGESESSEAMPSEPSALPDGESGAAGAATEPTRSDTTGPGNMSMMTYGLPFEVLGAPEASVQACAQLYMPKSGSGASNAPAMIAPTEARECAERDDGMLMMPLPADAHALLQVQGPGMLPFLVQVSTEGTPSMLKPLRLLNDVVLAKAMTLTGAFDTAAEHTVVVETPADGAQVTLTLARNDMRIVPLYVDAEGKVTTSERSHAGGWAVFTKLPEGVHGLAMTHPELRCSADARATWSVGQDGSIAVVAERAEDEVEMVPNVVTHVNAFDCR